MHPPLPRKTSPKVGGRWSTHPRIHMCLLWEGFNALQTSALGRAGITPLGADLIQKGGEVHVHDGGEIFIPRDEAVGEPGGSQGSGSWVRGPLGPCHQASYSLGVLHQHGLSCVWGHRTLVQQLLKLRVVDGCQVREHGWVRAVAKQGSQASLRL